MERSLGTTALALLDDYGSDIMFRLDAETKLTSLSSAAQRFFGGEVHRYLGRPFVELLKENERERWQTTFPKGAVPTRATLTVQDRDSEFEVFLRPDADEPSAWVGLARRVRGGQEITAETKLASGLAHELNQPLTAIGTTARACARILRSGQSETEEIIEAVDQIARQAERAAEIIRRMRNLMTRERRHRARTDLNQIIRDATRLLTADLKEAKVRLKLELAPVLPSVIVDEVQLSQVVYNLTRNALEAMTQAPVSQRFLTITSRRERQTAVVEVIDRGPGLSVEVVNRLFEPFVTTKPQGMGVGLALSRSFIQAHGGQLTARPNEDRGVTFSFSLPLAQENP